MSFQLDDAELIDAGGLAAPGPRCLLDPEDEEGAHRLAPARGIVLGLMLAAPLWAVLGFTLYLLI